MNLRLTSSAMALAAMTAPALADVTSDQVWQSWVDYYESMGYEVSEGARDTAGDTLTLRDVTIKGGLPESQVSMSMAQVTLQDTGDGKVTTVFSDDLTGVASGTDVDGETYEVPFTVTMPGNSMVTSGAPQDMTHSFDYPVMDLTLTTMKSGDTERPLPIKVGVADTTGSFHIVAGGPTKYDYDMTAGKVTFSGDVPSDQDGTVTFEGNMDGVETSGQATIPADARMDEDMNAALKAGMVMDGMLKAGALIASFDVSGTDENGQPTTGAGKFDGKGFDLTFAMSQDGLGYQASSDAGSFEISSSDMPFPISYAIESGAFDMQLPVMKSDAAQPFKLAYSLAGLTLGDAIWNMVDAQGQLPRDPASLDIDVTGTMKVTQDLFDPANLKGADTTLSTVPADKSIDNAVPGEPSGDATDSAADPMTDMAEDTPPPFEPVDVTINQFALNAVGAKVTAEGALKAPESGDMSAPIGEIHAQYEGINGLIDTLGSMGLIPEDQIMGVRMMMAMFAKPVAEGEDKLETRLEFKEGGAIFANGQQIK